jgi:hypothetical protein
MQLIINLELERFNKVIKKTETSLTSSSQQKDSYIKALMVKYFGLLKKVLLNMLYLSS